MRLPAFLQPVRRRLPLLICALLLAVVAVFSWAAYRRFERALLVAGGERVGGASRRLASALEESARRNRSEWKLGPADSAVERYLRSRGSRDAVRAGDAIRRRLAAGTQTMATQLRGADGVVLLSVGAPPSAAIGEPPRSAAPADPVPRGEFTGPFAAVGDTVYYEGVRPVVAARGDTIGYLAQHRRLSAGGPSAQLIRGLIGDEATVVLGNAQGGVWTDMSGVAPAPVTHLELGRAIAMTGRGGEPALGVVTRIQGTPWVVAVALPRRDLLAPARDLLGTTIWLAAVVLAVGALGAWALSRQITGPLAEITRAAKGIAAGDYSQRVTAEWRADELGQLAASFNSMASQVDGTTHELEHQMEQLQEQAGELEHQTEAAQALAQQLEASNEEISRGLVEAERARDEARAAEDRYQLLVNSLMVGVVLIDGAAGIVAANPAAERILGLTLDQMSGRSSVDREWGIVREDGSPQPPEQNPVVMSLRTGEPVSNNVAGVRRPDDTRVWIEVNAQPLFRPKESAPYAAVVSFADVTARKQLEAQLQQSQKMEAVGQLAGGVAHDFNNLLTVIKGHTEFALEELGTSSPQAATDLTTVREAADRAAALTRQLLAFSRQQILQPQVLDLNGLVSNFEKMVRRVIPADIAIVPNLAPDLGLIEADPGQLEQVLMNLVVNARDAMPGGGTVSIETANVELDPAFPAPHAPTEIRPGAYVALVVSDTGTGMDAATQARIFEPFFTTKERGHGTGLGLSTVYGIVKQSGGYVWVYSEPGHGTTFRIYLPRVASDAVNVQRTAEPAVVRGGGETILLVEDDVLVRALALRVLAKNGYRVLEAQNGADALRVSAASPAAIDLILSDLVMPEMGGRELAEQLRGRYAAARVLFISGYTEDAALRRSVLQPGEAFLAKPFTPDALARKVREVLDTPAGAAVPSLPMPGSRDPTRR